MALRRKKRETQDRRAEGCDQQDRPPAEAIGEVAADQRSDEGSGAEDSQGQRRKGFTQSPARGEIERQKRPDEGAGALDELAEAQQVHPAREIEIGAKHGLRRSRAEITAKMHKGNKRQIPPLWTPSCAFCASSRPAQPQKAH